MIASLRGRLLEVLADGAGSGRRGSVPGVPDPQGGAGPRDGRSWSTPSPTCADTALYGFATTDERRAFEQLLTATGVGPKLALAVLAVHAPDALRRAVSAGDTDALTLVPGVGRKGAARLVLELKGKLGDGEPDLPPEETGRPAYAEVREALGVLGYGPAEIKTALAALPPDAGPPRPRTCCVWPCAAPGPHGDRPL
jgi:Holliday junction DNA helicase RuvA